MSNTSRDRPHTHDTPKNVINVVLIEEKGHCHPKNMKVVRIEEDGRCHLIDWSPGSKLDGQNNDHENLFGLEHKGLKLGMFGLEWTQEHSPPEDMVALWDEEAKNMYTSYGVNKIAMKLLKRLRHHGVCVDYPVRIKGPVLLYDDASDMTRDKWNIIKDFLKHKK